MTIQPPPGMYSRAGYVHMENEPKGEQINRRIEDNAYMLGELDKAKKRAVFWKSVAVLGFMRDVDLRQVRVGRFERDHAEQEAPFWHDTTDAAGNVLIERQS